MAKKLSQEAVMQEVIEDITKYKVVKLLNVRENPDMDSKVVTTVRPGDEFVITEISGDFGKIPEGWIKMSGTERV